MNGQPLAGEVFKCMACGMAAPKGQPHGCTEYQRAYRQGILLEMVVAELRLMRETLNAISAKLEKGDGK
jgi:hypothetical protein